MVFTEWGKKKIRKKKISEKRKRKREKRTTIIFLYLGLLFKDANRKNGSSHRRKKKTGRV